AERVKVTPMFGQEERVRDAVVYLATSRNWVYAYDAEDPDESLPLWQTNLGTPVSRENIHPAYANFAAEIGITSTPLIERARRGDQAHPGDRGGGGGGDVVRRRQDGGAPPKGFPLRQAPARPGYPRGGGDGAAGDLGGAHDRRWPSDPVRHQDAPESAWPLA